MRRRPWRSHDVRHPRGWQWVAVCAAPVLALAGCAEVDEPDSGAATVVTSEPPTSSSPPAPSTADVEAALASLRGAALRTPDGISADLALYGAEQLTPQQVHAVAVDLCESGFDAAVVTQWLGDRPSVVLLPTTLRWLDYAGRPETCPAPPSEADAADYSSDVFASMAPLRPVDLDVGVAGTAETAVCNLLSSRAGGTVAEYVANALLEASTHGRFTGREAVAYGVQVAGAFCPHVMPVAVDAAAEYFGRRPAG